MEFEPTADQWDSHRRLWDVDADLYQFRTLAQQINPALTNSQFDHAWQFTTLLHADYNQARVEFRMLLNLAY